MADDLGYVDEDGVALAVKHWKDDSNGKYKVRFG